MFPTSNQICTLRAARAGFVSVAVAGLLAWTSARADEYTDVTRLLRAGQASEAMVMVDKLLVAKPKDPQLRFLKGVIQSEQGKAADAITTFTRLTEEFPELPEPYNNLAVIYANQNQFDKARAALEMAIRTNPSYGTAFENLGDVYAKLAGQAYAKALQLDTNIQGVQPKLNSIRELFIAGKAKPATGTAPRPAQAAAVAPAVAKPASPPPAAAPAPAAPAPAAAAAPATAALPGAGASAEVEASVRAWASAWASRDVNAYLATYAKEFSPQNGASRSSWQAERKERILGKRQIAVTVSDLQVSVNANKASARFKQGYKADSLDVQSRKTLEFAKVGDKWLIVREASGG